MNPPSPLEAIFFAALEKSTARERADYLDAACADDPETRRRLEKMLAAQSQSSDFLEAPPLELAGAVAAVAVDRPGTIIGPYKLLEQIGEGGFGVVFMAEQSVPVQRRVAVKILKAGMDSRQVIARFEAERQALAIMDHPNIAKVFDAGATAGAEPLGRGDGDDSRQADVATLATGRPYFVMELVKGVPITDFCDQQQLTTRQRLELFIPVCQAVQHAHQKGIIHRDLKPSNVLVTVHDVTPVPKVIDFGVAKALGGKLTDKTLFTGFVQMVGTPLYMSPEQAGLSGLDVDTRSDIYSLGVLLYELMTGTTPFDRERLGAASFDEIRRIIQDEEPARPSTRMSTLGLAATTMSTNRQSDPLKLSRLFRGELDWIVMKALEKDRNRRYETASALAADLQHYLADEPVRACPPSRWYRVSKFVRRNKGPVLAASLVLLALLCGVAGTSLGLVKAERARRDEVQARLAVEFERDQKEQARQLALANLKKAREAVERMLTRVAEERLLHVPQMEPLRRRLLVDALRLFEDLRQHSADDPIVHAETAYACARVGKICRLLGAYVDAERHLLRATAMLTEVAAAAPNDVRPRLERIDCRRQLGWVLIIQGRRREAEVMQRAGLEEAEQLFILFPQSVAHRNEVTQTCLNLAATVYRVRPEESAQLCARAIQLAQGHEDCRINLANAYRCQGELLQRSNQPRRAEPVLRQANAIYDALVRAEPHVWYYGLPKATTQAALAAALSKLGQYDEAEQNYRFAIKYIERLVADAPRVPYYADTLASWRMGLANTYRLRGQFHDAEAEYRRIAALLEARRDERGPTLETHETLPPGDQHWDGFLVAAREPMPIADRRAEPIAHRGGDGEGYMLTQHVLRTQVYHELGSLLATLGRTAEADAVFREAVGIFQRLEAQYAEDPEQQISVAHALARGALQLNHARQYGYAADVCHRAIGQFARLLTQHPDNRDYREWLAGEHFRLGLIKARQRQHDDSARAYIKAEAHYDQLAAAGPDRDDFLFAQASCNHNIALQWLRLQRVEAALGALRKSLQLYDKLPAAFRDKPGYRHNVSITANNLAWLLATAEDTALRNSVDAVAFAKQAVDLAANPGRMWNTLGVAHYRAGNWPEAIAALKKSLEARHGDDCYDWYFLALALQQSGDAPAAREWFDKANAWMTRHQPQNKELQRIRDEAADLFERR